jgi:hypothetical protein
MVGHGVRWFFAPPKGPHFHGKAESLVRSVKRCLTRTCKAALLTIGEGLTALAQVESGLNDRPFAAKNNPHDLDPMTPNHLFIGQANPPLEIRYKTQEPESPRMRLPMLRELSEQTNAMWKKSISRSCWVERSGTMRKNESRMRDLW